MRDGPGTLERIDEKIFRGDNLVQIPVAPAAFWSDVFVDRGLPWAGFLQSGSYHLLVLIVIWAGSRFLALQPRPTAQPAFTHADVVYYAPSEYLPPIDTRRTIAAHSTKEDPEYSAQPIISVPPEADNRSQTIVTPPNIQLRHEVRVPNVFAWQAEAQLPIGPAPAILASETSRLSPRIERSVVAPPTEIRENTHAVLKAPEPAVIAPPPALETDPTRRVGDLNIGHSSVIAPAPQLSLADQRAVPRRNLSDSRSRPSQVITPPPSLGASAGSRPRGSLIALNLHPSVGAPTGSVAGNRRGTFAATPEGHRGASGTAGASALGGTVNGTGSASKNSTNVPSGLYVGKNPTPTTSPVAGSPSSTNSSAYSVNPNLIANARPPRISARALRPESESKLSDVERAVFGNRKFYSLSLNMPNLNSAGGSWIIRFAALKAESNSPDSYSRAAAARSSPGAAPDDLSAPSATRKVDPAYPLELMRQNVSGTVILFGVIHADGTVGNIRVLRRVDERLDQFASDAIAKWRFQPATKNGAPVDVEATFWIPFHPARTGSNF